MDEIEETAISWTLGKMVIEASKAVQPRSYALENAWANRLPLQFGLARFEQRLADVGIQAIWAYGFVAFCLLVCAFGSVRRKLQVSAFLSSHKRRKPSFPGDVPIQPTPLRGWKMFGGNGSAESYSIEDGYDLSAPSASSRPFTTGRLRLWSRKLRNALSHGRLSNPHTSSGGYDPRHRPFTRHASMPLGTLSTPSFHQGGYLSQPPSPKGERFFTPAFSSSSNLSIPQTRAGSTSPEDGYPLHASASSVQIAPNPTPSINSSPPKLKSGRPARPKQNSHNTSLLSPKERGGGGWNDPPISMLSVHGTGHGQGSHGDLGSQASGTLTPTASGGFDALSRQSSRVNLSELGLAQRSASRSGTPHLPHDDGTS
jgi:hypothetical protein